MKFSPELWASVVNATVFFALMAVPWSVGKTRNLAAVLGFGGVAMLLGFDFWIGYEQQDYGLGFDLVTLTVLKAVFFFLVSLLVEKIVRLIMSIREAKKSPQVAQDTGVQEEFDRKMKPIKEQTGKIIGS